MEVAKLQRSTDGNQSELPRCGIISPGIARSATPCEGSGPMTPS